MLKNKQLSIVVPVYNEAGIISAFHERLTQVLKTLPFFVEIIYVNDGSTDVSVAILNTLKTKDHRVAIVDLSRNFGKEIALSAGLDYTQGDAVIVIDSDLQDPPELIPKLVEQWQHGYDVVFAKRTSRAGESWIKKYSAQLFYRLLHKISPVEIPVDTGDFRLLSRRTVEALKNLRETHRYMKGLFSWVGFPQIAVPYERDPRFGGESKFNYWKLWNLAIEGITSFSIAPLKFATYFGFLTASAAFIYALVIIYKTLAFGEPVQGYPSLMVVMLFLGGIQLITLGIIGEYLGRTFVETKRRPLYLVKHYDPALAVVLDSSEIS
jgi:glycosyltransferase involved in cell wall biosynthesis